MSMFNKNKFHKKSGRGTVLVIALLLITSGILRLATGADSAVAKVAEVMNGANVETNGEESMQAEAIAPNTPTPDVGDLLAALQTREALVKKQEVAIEMRKKALEVADEQIAIRLETLANAEKTLRATLSLADGAAENDLAQLTSVYENMKPKDAAALFEQMEPTFAAGFLGRMRPEAAAAIMAGLSPGVGYSISVIFAGRNAMVPKS